MEIKVLETDNLRIDKYLALKTNLTRSKIQKLIKNKNILVNNQFVTNNYQVLVNDLIIINNYLDEPNILKPANIPLDIIYEDEYLLVINKKSGMVVHPAPGNYEKTLVNALLYKYKLSNHQIRPGIVHRLDKDTSGLMLVAKDDDTHEKLSKLIKDKIVKRYYLALVEGTFNHQTGTIDAPIGRDLKNREKMTVTSLNSKQAITHFKVLERFLNHTLIECQLETGRTHQIRVHLSYINHPVVGDALYGKKIKNSDFGQLLHSYKIKFPHPQTNQLLEFEIKLPQEFQTLMEEITIKSR